MKRGKAIRTNGIGMPCLTHLNRSRSLADFWTIKPEPVRVRIQGTPEVYPPPVRQMTSKIEPPARIPPFAGYDPTERAL